MLSDLAKESGVSRAVLAERFHHLMGTPPMTYLTGWRLQLGTRMLAVAHREAPHFCPPSLQVKPPVRLTWICRLSKVSSLIADSSTRNATRFLTP